MTSSRRAGIGRVVTMAEMAGMEWCLMCQITEQVNVNADVSEAEVGRETRPGREGGGVRDQGHHEVRDIGIVSQIGVRRLDRMGHVRALLLLGRPLS